MRKKYLLSLPAFLLISATIAYTEDIPKFTNDDLRRYRSDPQDAEGNAGGVVFLQKQDISGTWKFVCCSGKYWGEIDLNVDEHKNISGHFFDMANKSGGTIEGTVTGNIVYFTRNKGEQDYKLTISDDGTEMSGFFVGIHDGSVGTEVSLSRSDARQSPSEADTQDGLLTSWKDAGEFEKEMTEFWKREYYPASVEGRTAGGGSQFRAWVLPFPKKVWWFNWWYNQSASQYEERGKKMIADGFKEIHVQVFTDAQGVRKYQTCWIKYGK